MVRSTLIHFKLLTLLRPLLFHQINIAPIQGMVIFVWVHLDVVDQLLLVNVLYALRFLLTHLKSLRKRLRRVVVRLDGALTMITTLVIILDVSIRPILFMV